MPGPGGLITVALDFDGSLVEDKVSPPRWRRGAKEFILGAASSGIRLILHSCRNTVVGYQEMPGDAREFWRSGRVPPDIEYSWQLREELRGFLEVEGVLGLVEIWEAPGKPIADYYADDRAERPDWLVLAAELGVSLRHEVGRSQAVGGAVVVAAPGAPATGGGGPAPGPEPAAPVPAAST